MKKFKKVFARVFWSESNNDLVLKPDQEAEFHINLGKLLIGTLSYSAGVWYFSYSSNFKLQTKILPLANFPSKDKKYSAQELWPFFASRIPSNAQLQLDKNQPKENIITLLNKFGQRTISNPYELKQVDEVI